MKSILFFDFDDTLINGDTILYWKAFYFRKRPFMRFFQLVNLLALILRILKILPTKYFKLILFWPLCFEKTFARKKLAKDFFITYIQKNLFLEMVDIINKAHQKGCQVVIISASHLFYLKELQILFPFAQIVGTNITFTGLFPSYKDWGNMKHETKVHYIQSQFGNNTRDYIAYSDSHADFPLLKFVKTAFVVRPTNKLKTIAKKYNWENIPIKDHPRQPFRKFFLLLFDIDIKRKT